MSAKAIAERLIIAVREEIRRCALTSEPLPAIPLPTDLEAEGEICALILNGYATPERLKPLEPRHFYSELHRLILATATIVCDRGELCEFETIAAELERRGTIAPVLEELDTLRLYTPFIIETTLRRHVARIIELWRLRRICKVLIEVDAMVRVGALGSDAARAKLEARLTEICAEEGLTDV